MKQITDKDGNTYKTVEIGSQEWMAENLNVSHFRNGDPIPEARTNEEWVKAGENEQPAWCYYDNDRKNGKIYGKLYNWHVVNDPRGLAPEGWPVPSNGDWTKLTDYLGGEDDAGGKLKQTGTTHWWGPNEGATNETDFTALPGGSRLNDGTFDSIGGYGGWWSATESFFAGNAWERGVYYSYSSVGMYFDYKEAGFSVRCLRD